MTDIVTILKQAVAENASDVFLVAGRSCSFRKNGAIHPVDAERLLPPDTEALLKAIYTLAGNRDMTARARRRRLRLCHPGGIPLPCQRL